MGSVVGPWGTAIGAVVGGVAGLLGTKKTPKPTSIDIGKLVEDARVNAETNLQTALRLESQYLPGQAAARASTDEFLASQFTGASAQAREASLRGALGLAADRGVSTLTQSAADQILADLQMGSQLDPETQAQVMRGALSGAGTSGIMGSQAGRGLAARDLGLTGLQLRGARQQAAMTAGNVLDSRYLESLGLLSDIQGRNLQLASGAAGVMGSRPLPEAGLSSGSLAAVTIGDTQSLNQYRLADAEAKNKALQSALQSGLGLAGVYKDWRSANTNPPPDGRT
jgi:hypothetical protein